MHTCELLMSGLRNRPKINQNWIDYSEEKRSDFTIVRNTPRHLITILVSCTKGFSVNWATLLLYCSPFVAAHMDCIFRSFSLFQRCRQLQLDVVENVSQPNGIRDYRWDRRWNEFFCSFARESKEVRLLFPEFYGAEWSSLPTSNGLNGWKKNAEELREAIVPMYRDRPAADRRGG